MYVLCYVCMYVLRELVAATGTLVVMLNEERITNLYFIVHLVASTRTFILVVIALVVYVFCYVLGAFIGRLAEAISHVCCRCCCRTSANDYRNFP